VRDVSASPSGTPPFGSDAHLADVALAAGAMIHSSDANGIIRWANRAWLETLGYDAAEIAAGIPMVDVIAPERRGRATDNFARLAAGERLTIEEVMYTRRGQRILVSVQSEAKRDPATGKILWTRTVLRDITAERAMQGLARDAERRHRATLEGLREGVAVLDAEGTVQFLNPAAATLLGVDAAQVMGRNLLSFPWRMFDADGAHRARETHPAFVALQERRTIIGDRMIVLRGPRAAAAGSRLWLDVNAVLLDPADPESTVVCSFRDVSADVQSQRLQAELIGVVAHELRAPLTSLRGALGILAASPAAAEGQGAALVPMAVRNVERLERLVTDLLDLERLEAGQVTLERSVADVQALFDDAVEVHAVRAAEASVTLRVEPSDARVSIDLPRMQQVLRNLVGNAIKFSPEGGTVTLDAVPAGGRSLAIRVTDQGRGVPLDQRERIFERFAQVHRDDAKRLGGAGLGLSISRAIAEAHGGRIHVEDGVGGGSRFVVTLPVS
jgi:PAS domain S-box-containing protein